MPLRRGSWLFVIGAVGLAACTSQSAQLQQHREKFESLGSSTAAIAEAWLNGSTNETYTSTALQQTFLLVEKERQALAAEPAALADTQGAELSQASEQLERVIADLLDGVRKDNRDTVGQRLHTIPISARPR